MKKLSIHLLIIACLLTISSLFSGCHSHVWKDADCQNPKTCLECGATEGEPSGHVWSDATCTDPKTCSICGLTEGEPLGHKWSDATCTSPKTCSVCHATEGSALGHDWGEATCTEPQKCKVCGSVKTGTELGHVGTATCTEGFVCERCGAEIAALGHKWSEATCTEPRKCTVCGETDGEPLGHTTDSGKCGRCGKEIYSEVKGHGDDVRSDINFGDGLFRVRFTHSGRRNFAIWGYDSNDDRDLLVNEIGKYDGRVFLGGDAPYTFEITADGDWTYELEPLTVTNEESFSGKGDYVTDLFSSTKKVWHFTHSGKSNFAVWGYNSDGRDLLVNEIGNYDGKVRFSIPSSSYAFFVITADGSWSVTPE